MIMSSAWTQYDAVELIRKGHRNGEILVDQGEADNFLQEQLKPELLSSVCVEVRPAFAVADAARL